MVCRQEMPANYLLGGNDPRFSNIMRMRKQVRIAKSCENGGRVVRSCDRELMCHTVGSCELRGL